VTFCSDSILAGCAGCEDNRTACGRHPHYVLACGQMNIEGLLRGVSISVCINQNHLNRDGREMSLQALNIVYQLFSEGYAGGHLLMQGVAGDNLDAHVRLILVKKYWNLAIS